MNACFYQAIDRIPLGLATTVEFLGPPSSRCGGLAGRSTSSGIALAGAGRFWSPSVELDPVGLAFAFEPRRWAATSSSRSACSTTGRSGRAFRSPSSWPPPCWPRFDRRRGSALLDWSVLAVGLVVAVLGSVLPFALELGALRQISAATFGILLSLGARGRGVRRRGRARAGADGGRGRRHRPRDHRLGGGERGCPPRRPTRAISSSARRRCDERSPPSPL